MEPGWRSTTVTDPMTDEKRCMVVYGDVLTTGGSTSVFGLKGHLYPFAQLASSGPIVGIRSLPYAGNFAPPVGDVEVRVDDLPMQTLLAIETPRNGGANSSAAALINQSREQVVAMMKAQGMSQDAISAATASYGKTGTNVEGMMAGYTAVGGERATELIDAMKRGGVLLYRQKGSALVSNGVPVALTGFREAAARCGL